MILVDPAAERALLTEYIEKMLPGCVFLKDGLAESTGAALSRHGESFSLTLVRPAGAVFLSDGGTDAAEHAEYIMERGIKSISGDNESLGLLAPYFPVADDGTSFLMGADSLTEEPSAFAAMDVHTVQGAAKVYGILSSLDEYRGILDEENEWAAAQADAISAGAIALCYTEKDGIPASTACLTALSYKRSAILAGVGTRCGMQRQGAAAAAVRHICGKAFAEGRTVYLFCTNPAARSLYEKLGFRHIALWRVLNIP